MMPHCRTMFLAAMLLLIGAGAALAVEPDERLADPALETRARGISAGLRCLICQNQSIDESSAPLARDLRLLVRERLKAGGTDADVERFIVDRYGEYVLLRPRFSIKTLMLWLAPLALLGVVVASLWRRAKDARSSAALGQSTAPLSPEEQARLDKILSERGAD